MIICLKLNLLLNLHSTIFILKQDTSASSIFIFSFTFYNIYIKTVLYDKVAETENKFTFYNIYIKT
mgnify:CR=1 FL=1